MRRFGTLLASIVVAGCSLWPGSGRPLSALPPSNAEPAVVVAAYLDALVAGDCAKARALSTPNALANRAAPWCDRPRVTGYSELSRDGVHPNADEAVYAVELTIRGGDVSLPDGEHTMFVQVLLQPGGAWRVNGVGSGP